MEDLKLAFETIVVGLMAIPWLLVLLHILFYITSGTRLVGKVRTFFQDTEQSFAITGTFILGIAYCLGTILFPVADKLFNDNHNYLGVRIKKDAEIRADVLAESYFDDKLYKLSAKDFPDSVGLPDGIEINIEPDANRLVAINKEEKKEGKIDSDKERKDIYGRLNKTFHRIYNHQKYSVYNSSGDYELLKPLKSQIVVLRGAVLNGLCLLLALIILIFYALLEYLGKLLLKKPVSYSRREFALAFIPLILLSTLVWFFCWYGAWGVTEAEKEYDKHVVGLFYGQKANEALKKTAEQVPKPNPPTQPNKSPSPKPR